jgi:hypothetical protein
METKTIKLEISENVIPLPIREETEVNGKWVYVEFPYRHLLPVLEAA